MLKLGIGGTHGLRLAAGTLLAAFYITGCGGGERVATAPPPTAAPQPSPTPSVFPAQNVARGEIVLKPDASGTGCGVFVSSRVIAKKRFVVVWDLSNACDSKKHKVRVDDFVLMSNPSVTLSLDCKAGKAHEFSSGAGRITCIVEDGATAGLYSYNVYLDASTTPATDPELEIQN